MARALRPVPESPRRALGLIRVSKEREAMISPEVQRTAISDYAARRGYDVVEWMEGIDESGSRARSAWWPRLEQAVEKIEAHAVDVILVWKYSRTARHRLRWAVALDRVETAGGAIESATEQIDTTTSTGRFTRGMLAELNAFEAERIGDTWREAHAHRVAAGLPANGKPRFGYRYADGIHSPDPDTGPVLAALYRRYIAGESVYGLVAWLNAEGYRTVAGYSRRGPGPWTQVTLRRMLDSGFGAGFIIVRGERRPGAHQPVIDADLWQQYLATRMSRRTLRRAERSTYLLSGLMRCMHPLDGGAPCDSPMGGGQFGSQRQPKYRCLAVAQERRHLGGYVTMAVAEAEVMAWLVEQAAKVEQVAKSQRNPARVQARKKRDTDAIAREIGELETQLARLTVQHTRGIVPESAYIAARDEITAEKQLLEERFARETLAVPRQHAGPIAERFLAHMAAGQLEMPQRRAILRSLIARVEVCPGRPRAAIKIVPN